MKSFFAHALTLCIIGSFTIIGTANAQYKLYFNEFPLGDVTLLDGPLKKARDLNIQTLLQYDCDRLLAPYRKEAGLEPRAKTYPNWDGLDGHVGGHYLTAMAMNAATGNGRSSESHQARLNGRVVTDEDEVDKIFKRLE